MKSGKQRRHQLQDSRADKRELKAAEAKTDQKASRLAADTQAQDAKQRLLATIDKRRHVNPEKLADNPSQGWPEFVHLGHYTDKPFVCVTCGSAQVWLATQQKWWYEVAKGSVWTQAKYCKPCRRKEQARKTEARRIHQEGLAHKTQGHETAPKTRETT